MLQASEGLIYIPSGFPESDPLELDPASTAFLIVDMQEEFLHDLGAFGDRDRSHLHEIVPATARFLAEARRAGMRVIHLRMACRPDLSDAGTRNSRARRAMDFRFLGEPAPGPRGETGSHFVDGSWSTEIIPELAPVASDIVITKTRFSGFWGTNLDAVLRQSGIKTLVVAGEATSVCVESTVRDAMFLDYNCVTLTDCTGELFGRPAHDAALWRLGTLFGWTCMSTDLSEALRQVVPEAISVSV